MGLIDEWPESLAQPPTPWPHHEAHFASGVNHPGEVQGLAEAAHWIGITLAHVTDSLIDAIHDWVACSKLKVFIDSGAFSEVEFGEEGRVVVRPITHADWIKRLAICAEMTKIMQPGQLFIVAPDSVGDQDETLKRLKRYAPQVRALAEARANIIIPCQKGRLSMWCFWRQALFILGLDNGLLRERAIAGIPMKKDATSLHELARFCADLGHVYPGAPGLWTNRLHLLGLGPESPRFAGAIEAIRLNCPHADVTSDSVTIRRLVGRTNGAGGNPRALTAAQDRARGSGLSDPAEIKAAALREVLSAETAQKLAQAIEAGWYDEELGPPDVTQQAA